MLMVNAESDADGQARASAFRQGLHELGWTVGRNVQIDYRWGAGEPDRARAYAAELVALSPDAILGAPPTRRGDEPVRKATPATARSAAMTPLRWIVTLRSLR